MDVLNQIIKFVMDHSVAMGAAAVAVLDFLFAINKAWESNGILHSIYVFCKNLVSKKEA